MLSYLGNDSQLLKVINLQLTHLPSEISCSDVVPTYKPEPEQLQPASKKTTQNAENHTQKIGPASESYLKLFPVS